MVVNGYKWYIRYSHLVIGFTGGKNQGTVEEKYFAVYIFLLKL